MRQRQSGFIQEGFDFDLPFGSAGVRKEVDFEDLQCLRPVDRFGLLKDPPGRFEGQGLCLAYKLRVAFYLKCRFDRVEQLTRSFIRTDAMEPLDTALSDLFGQLVAYSAPSQPILVSGQSYWVDANPRWPGVYYRQTQGDCRYGGVRSGNGNCQLTALPSNMLEDHLKYWVETDPRWPGIYYRATY